jgi:hypothetical protein
MTSSARCCQAALPNCAHGAPLTCSARRVPSCRPLRALASAAEPLRATVPDCKHDPDQLPHLPDPRPVPKVDTGINVAQYVQENYKPYDGPTTFLAGPTERTKKLWSQLEKLICVEVSGARLSGGCGSRQAALASVPELATSSVTARAAQTCDNVRYSPVAGHIQRSWHLLTPILRRFGPPRRSRRACLTWTPPSPRPSPASRRATLTRSWSRWSACR